MTFSVNNSPSQAVKASMSLAPDPGRLDQQLETDVFE